MPRSLAGPAAIVAFVCATAGAAAAPPAPGTLVFPSNRCDGGGVPVEILPGVNVCRTSIFRVNPDGTGLTRLTRGSSPQDEKANVGGEGTAVWSPDGGQIAFSRSTPNGTRIFTMNADGSKQRQLFD